MKIESTRQRGVGAAHIGYWMPGLRAPLLAPEGAGGGGGAPAGGTGGGSPDTTTPTQTPAQPGGAPTTPAGTAPAGNEQLLPQSRVNELVGRARQEGRESALREQQQGQQPRAGGNAGGEPSKASPLTEQDVVNLFARERAFTLASTGTYQITPSQLTRMEEAYRAARPADVGAWSKAYAEDMGFKSIAGAPAAGGATTNTNNSSTPNAGTQQPPASAPLSPSRVDPVTAGGLVDIWNLSLEQVNQLGPDGIRAEHEKILAAANRKSGAPPLPKVLQKR